MFIKARVLYTINTNQFNSKAIFEDLKKNKLLPGYFSSREFLDSDLLNFFNTLPNGTIFAKKITLTNEDSSSFFIALPFYRKKYEIGI